MFQLGKEATDFFKELLVLVLDNHPGHEVTTETGGLDVGQEAVGEAEDVVDGVVVANDDLTGNKGCPEDLGLLVGTLGLMRKEGIDLLGGLLTQGDGVLKGRGTVVEEEEVGVAAMAQGTTVIGERERGHEEDYGANGSNGDSGKTLCTTAEGEIGRERQTLRAKRRGSEDGRTSG
jgi:hypothetical protein